MRKDEKGKKKRTRKSKKKKLTSVKPGHLRRLPSQQHAAAPRAPLHDPLHHALGHVDVQLARRVVVEEEERRSPRGDDVVDGHRDEVDADGVVDAGVHGEAELGADAVGAGDEEGVAFDCLCVGVGGWREFFLL